MPRERSGKRDSATRSSVTRASLRSSTRSSRDGRADANAEAMKAALVEAKTAADEMMKYSVAREDDNTFAGASRNEMEVRAARIQKQRQGDSYECARPLAHAPGHPFCAARPHPHA
jgi:hypothetical protein